MSDASENVVIGLLGGILGLLFVIVENTFSIVHALEHLGVRP